MSYCKFITKVVVTQVCSYFMAWCLLLGTVVSQVYDTDVNKEYVIRGNAAVLKCQVPSFVADFVTVVSWHTDQAEDFYPSTQFGNLR